MPPKASNQKNTAKGDNARTIVDTNIIAVDDFGYGCGSHIIYLRITAKPCISPTPEQTLGSAERLTLEPLPAGNAQYRPARLKSPTDNPTPYNGPPYAHPTLDR